MVKPADFKKDRSYPIAYLVHGGPQSSFANAWSWRWNAQAFAGAGYGVVMIDFHGSTGYGQAFTDSISGDWGGKPLEDLKLGLAAALKQYPWLDGSHVCALGASYGGYMMNWIAGQWPDRFKCIVSHDGIFDEPDGSIYLNAAIGKAKLSAGLFDKLCNTVLRQIEIRADHAENQDSSEHVERRPRAALALR